MRGFIDRKSTDDQYVKVYKLRSLAELHVTPREDIVEVMVRRPVDIEELRQSFEKHFIKNGKIVFRHEEEVDTLFLAAIFGSRHA